jgi:hypothetical protein
MWECLSPNSVVRTEIRHTSALLTLLQPSTQHAGLKAGEGASFVLVGMQTRPLRLVWEYQSGRRRVENGTGVKETSRRWI